MSTRRSVLLAGAAVLAVALVAPTAAPLYDGIGFPDEPYRYVLRPPGQAPVTPPPTGVNTTVTAAYGLNNQAVVASSEEQSAQISLYLPRGALTTTMSATSVEVRVVPLAPTLQPPDAVVSGNAYAITVTGQDGPVTVTPAAAGGVVVLRGDRGNGLTFEYQPAGAATLTRLDTQQVSGDRYQTRFAGLGTYALARLTTPKSLATNSFPALPVGIGGLLVALMAGVVVSVRRSRRSLPPP